MSALIKSTPLWMSWRKKIAAKKQESKEGEKGKVLAWLEKVDPKRWAQIGGQEGLRRNGQFEVLVIEYFINQKHKEGWELMFMQNNFTGQSFLF